MSFCSALCLVPRRARLFFLLLAAFSAAAASFASTNLSAWAFPGSSGRLLRQPDALGNRVLDYSGVGYKGGAVPLPVVPVKVTISPVAGDNVANLQNAINQVAALPLDANGFRGAVFLNAGEYALSNTIKVTSSGIVLRGAGSGTDGTVLRATATNQYTLISITGSGSASTVANTTHNITNNYVPVGAASFQVDSVSGLAVNDRVFARRVATSNWISDLGMDLLCCEPDVSAWTPSGYHQDFDRVITRIEGNRVFLDAPITTAIDAGRYTNGTIRKYTWAGRISNCGIEHLRGVSDYAAADDENHGWTFVQFNTIENGWAQDLTSQYFGYSCVALSSGARFVTVADCQCLDPVSIITGGRRYAFVMDDNTMCLVRNCYTRMDRHQFVTQSLTTGPNVFVDGLSDSAQSDAGPHHRWGTGALWDNIVVNGNNLNVQNRGNLGSGHGWAGANEVVWDCKASGFVVQNPPGAHNWLIGSIGSIQNGTVYVGPHAPGTYDSSGSSGAYVYPNSLYYAQLQERLAGPSLRRFDYWLGDMRGFTNPPAGGVTVPVDAAWLATIQTAAAGEPVDKFDVVAAGHWVPFTFNFTLAADGKVVGASLAVSLLAAGATATNDVLYLDSTTNAYTFASLGWLPISTAVTNPSVRLLDLGAQLGLLSDGKLNVAVQDDVGVDWAMLELKIAKNSAAITNILTPVADAFVRGGIYASSNFGSSTVLTVKEDTSSDVDRKAYLRWDLGGLGGTLLEARVRLYPTSVGTNGIEHGAAVAAADAWTDSGITWNNQPGAGKRFATWIPGAGVPVEFAVTPQVLEALAGDGQFSLQLYSLYNVGAPGLVDYASSRDPNPAIRPQLILVFDGVKWNGNLSGTWNTTTANWLTVAGGAASIYHETTLPGDAVLFDDTAAGTTAVTLTSLVSPGAITVNNTAKNYTFGGAGRFNTGLLTKQGSGALSFGTAGSNYFGAGLTLEAGMIQISGAAGFGSVRFASAGGGSAALNFNSASVLLFGDVTAGAGTDSLGLNNSVATLAGQAGSALASLGNVALTNSILMLPVSSGYSSLYANTLTTGGSSNLIQVASVSGVTAYPSQIHLLRYSGALAGAGYNFVLGTLPPGISAYLSNNVAGGSIDLVVTATTNPGSPVWTGTVSGDWDIGGTFNWKGMLSGLPVTYQDGDAVRFDDSASGLRTVNLAATVSPAGLTVSNTTLAYAFGGAGAISGPAQLLKQGTGTLVLSNAGVNTFTGGVNLGGGTLRLAGGANRLPTNSVVLLANTAGTALDLNGQSQTLASLAGGGPGGGNVLLGSAALTINGGHNDTLSGSISGSGSLTLSGGSTLFLSGTNTFTGAVNISDGILRATTSSALGTSAGGVSLGNTVNARLELAGGITVADPITISCKGSALNGVPAVENISGTNTLTGAIKGTTGGSDWTFQVDAGRLIVSGDFTNLATSNVRNLKLRGPGDGEWRGDIANGVGSSTAVWKDGTGTWTLSGNNTYQGPTTVNSGVLRANNVAGSATGPGVVTVYSAATLAGFGTVAGVVNLLAGAAVAPGNGVGTLSTGPVLWNGGSLYHWELGQASGSAGVNWDLLQVAGDLGFNATPTNPVIIKVNAAGLTGFNRATNYSWTIATAARLTNFNAATVTVDTTGFTNDLAGGYFLGQTGAASLSVVFTNNHAPQAGTIAYSRLPGAGLQIPVSELLASATSDADGDPRALVSVYGGTNAASLTVSNGFILYVPANAAADQFNFMVKDVRTNPPALYHTGDTLLTDTGTVLVQVLPDPSFRFLSASVVAPGTNQLHFSGLSGQPYLVQFATNLAVPTDWFALAAVTAGFNGQLTAQDIRATNRQRFYRVISGP